MSKVIKKKKKNPNDATFRNINAIKKQMIKIQKEMKILNDYLHTFGD